jgi:hypothetical protein
MPNCGGSQTRFSSEAGHPDAQIALSEMYAQGVGVEHDPERAHYWAELAALRVSEDDAARQRALDARSRAAAMLGPEEREGSAAMAACLVAGMLDDIDESLIAADPAVLSCAASLARGPR